MKKLITGIFLIVSIAFVQAQTPNSQAFGIKQYQYYGQDEKGNALVTFSSGNKIEMCNMEGTDVYSNEKSGTYTTSAVNGLDFINITYSTGANEKFLFLTLNDNTSLPINRLYLYKSDSGPYFGHIRESWFTTHVKFGNSSWITASSSLEEKTGGKTVIYSPDKLGYKIGECWVPAKPLNEKLILSVDYGFTMEDQRASRQRTPSKGGFYISSGFISFSKPHLYRENARPKKIRLSSNHGETRIIDLADTPHFQPLPIDEMLDDNNTAKITIEILEVYPGTKYKDVCINAICYFWSRG